MTPAPRVAALVRTGAAASGWLRGAALSTLFSWPLLAAAQTQTAVGVPARGQGSMTLSLQQAESSRFRVPEAFGGGLREGGDLTHRTMSLEIDYGLTDRLALTAWLPFKSNRYVGDAPHDPARLLDPHGETLRDDGRYHSGWGDWGLGLRWLWRTEPVAITPFVSFHHPANRYPIFTITAFGTQQWRLDAGVNAGGRLPGPVANLYWQLGYAYSYMEKTRPNDSPDHRVNHSIVNAEVGWQATPGLNLSLGWRYRRAHGGLRMPEDFNPPFIDDLYYYHDQLFPLEQSVATLGLSYQVNDRYTVHGSYGRTLHVAFGSEIKHAFSVGVTRSF